MKKQKHCTNVIINLQSIRNLNLFATLVTGYIGIMSCEKDDTIFMLELKECSKRIFDVPKFIFYGLGYAIERVLARTHSGIKGFLLKKEQSQQLTLAECFAEWVSSDSGLKNGETQKTIYQLIYSPKSAILKLK